MNVAVFSTHRFEREYLAKANQNKHQFKMLEIRLSLDSAALAEGCEAVCIFVSDEAQGAVIEKLFSVGVRFIAIRAAGFNNVDRGKAIEKGMRVARVPAYSPNSVSEHAVALMMALNRKLVTANRRIMDSNFSLDGLVGFDMNGKTVGIVGTGKIGALVAKILSGFGCRIKAYDKYENDSLRTAYGVQYVDFTTLCRQSDIITLHAPLTPDTKYMINKTSIQNMKRGMMLINTSRGGLVNTKDVIGALKSGLIGYLGLDVYEEEEGLFFEDHSGDILMDDTIARLMSFKNVLITSHQAFLTDTALTNIADTTVYNLDCFEQRIPCENELS